MRDKAQLKSMWERFIHDSRLDPKLDKTIRDSWLRSKSYNVDPHQKQGGVHLTDRQLTDLLQSKKDLIDISLPLMEHLYAIVKGSGFLVILCDENGFLIKVIGDAGTLRIAEEIRFVEGASWNEKAMGTNAIGTCLAIDAPIQVFAAEHYSLCCHLWTCSASPIHDVDGKVIGVLNMSGPFEKVHPHTLGMVVSTVKAIENELQINAKVQKNEMMKTFLEATTDTISDGLVMIDEDGYIVRTNRMLHRIVQLSEEQLVGKKVNEVFTNRVFNRIPVSQTETIHQELKLKVAANRSQTHVMITFKPVRKKNKVLGSLITIKEIHKVRQLVNNLSGNQAKMTMQDILGKSPVIEHAKKEATFAAQSSSNVLLTGESGTGKDVFAQAIHNANDRANHPFIAINCGGIPRDLLGSELFGYVEGAFTGARKGGSPGKFELADGGTLFLDEIGEMSLEMQVLLLRVLQDKELVRIGGHRIIPVDVRIIAATNKDLREEVRKGNFREDLFFRLNVIPIHLPPLRERKEDIPILVDFFLHQLNARLGKRISGVTRDFLHMLARHYWPGNVRELQNVLERSVVRAEQSMLDVEALPEEIRLIEQPAARDELPRKDKIKKQALLHSIHLFDGNYSQAARYLGISRSTLYRQMERFGIR